MASEYELVFPDRSEVPDDLGPVQERFATASRPFLSSPWSWFAWAVVLPATALLTPRAFAFRGGSAVLFLWSASILLGGSVEFGGMLRRGFARSTPLAGWALRAQGNLSLVGVALSALLIWQEVPWALPGLWLLLLGHSLFLLGGLAFPPFRKTGVLYQLAGALALLPFAQPLVVFAIATFAGNAYLGFAVWRLGR